MIVVPLVEDVTLALCVGMLSRIRSAVVKRMLARAYSWASLESHGLLLLA
jgi:hypothetical protein